MSSHSLVTLGVNTAVSKGFTVQLWVRERQLVVEESSSSSWILLLTGWPFLPLRKHKCCFRGTQSAFRHILLWLFKTHPFILIWKNFLFFFFLREQYSCFSSSCLLVFSRDGISSFFSINACCFLFFFFPPTYFPSNRIEHPDWKQVYWGTKCRFLIFMLRCTKIIVLTVLYFCCVGILHALQAHFFWEMWGCLPLLIRIGFTKR